MKTIADLAVRYGISEERVRQLCREGRVAGAVRVGRQWILDNESSLPSRKNGRPQTAMKDASPLPGNVRKQKDRAQVAFKKKKILLRPFEGCRLLISEFK